MRKVVLGVAVATALVVLGAGPAPAAPPAKVLTLADSGSTVTLVPGQRLRVKLEVCYSCGYRWATRRAPAPRVLRRRPQRQQSTGNCQPPCVGGSAVTIFRYVARARGRTRLRLGYIPPGSSTAEQTFRLRVRVTGG
jgi:predicted secreted protein